MKPGDNRVEQRRFPYPYKAMVAICSDTDAMSPWEFMRVHRFLNTLTPAIPHYGDGIGLDIGDSFFFKNMSSKNGLAVFNACYRYNDEQAWLNEFAGEESRVWNPANARDPMTGRLVFPNGPKFLEKFIRCGWIDVLHGGEGSWAENSFKRGASDWCRTDGEHYRDWVADNNFKIDTFTNHSTVTSDFGIPAQPSTKEKPRCLGDLPSSSAYWADYARESGLKFYWSYIPSESAAYRRTFGQRTVLTPATFRDGGKFWHFGRYDAGRPYADTIESILNVRNLNSLIVTETFEIAYTHLGYWSDDENHVHPELSPNTIAAFRLLKKYQDNGYILVARTSRLLRYNLARDYLAFDALEKDGQTVLDITAIKDTQFGGFTPTIEDLRGVTFYVPDSTTAELRIRGARIPEDEIQRNTADDRGKESIGVKWFQFDHTDYTTSVYTDVNSSFPVGASV